MFIVFELKGEESMSDVLVIGEAFVDFLPKEVGRLRHVGGFEMYGGGAPANVARGVSRLGISSALISVIGDDEFSDFVLESLTKDAVATQGIRRLQGGRTQLCFVTLDDRGDRHFTGRGPDASLSLGVQDIHPALFEEVKALVITCGSLRTRQGVYAVERAIQANGGLLVCDPGICPPEWCDPQVMRRRLWGVFMRCDLLKCSDHETYWLIDEDDPMKAAQAFVREGVKCAVVTCGEAGAVWATKTSSGRVPSPHVPIVDTTGAGDAFMSAIVARLTIEALPPSTLPSERLEAHLAFSSHIGALAVTQKGAVNGIPTLNTQEALMRAWGREDLPADSTEEPDP